MLERCDFDEQVTSDADSGRMRPDMVVHLPGGKNVAVDAKVPMQAFLDANEADDESVRRSCLASHGRQMKAHVDALSKKEYWKRVDPSPEFVVAFIPGDPLLTAALEHEPGLMEYAVANHVLLATPTSLIALLRAVAYGWQQEALAENAREVQLLGAELYQRLSVLGEHVSGVGQGLEQCGGRLQQGGRVARGPGPGDRSTIRRDGRGRGGGEGAGPPSLGGRHHQGPAVARAHSAHLRPSGSDRSQRTGGAGRGRLLGGPSLTGVIGRGHWPSGVPKSHSECRGAHSGLERVLVRFERGPTG